MPSLVLDFLSLTCVVCYNAIAKLNGHRCIQLHAGAALLIGCYCVLGQFDHAGDLADTAASYHASCECLIDAHT